MAINGEVSVSPGTIFTNQSMSASSAESVVQLVVVARDGGSPSLSTNVAVQVQITAVNNFSPQFLQPNYRSVSQLVTQLVGQSVGWSVSWSLSWFVCLFHCLTSS